MVSIQKMISAEFSKAELCNGIPPDEVIAVGAAWQAEVSFQTMEGNENGALSDFTS